MKISYVLLDTRTRGQCEGEVIRIGRDPDCEIAIDPTNEIVSRRHAMIREESGRFFLEDLGSRNGTYLNHRAIEHPALLQAGDRIRLGNPGPEILAEALTSPRSGASSPARPVAAPASAPLPPAGASSPFRPRGAAAPASPEIPAYSASPGTSSAEMSTGALAADLGKRLSKRFWNINPALVIAGAGVVILFAAAILFWLFHSPKGQLTRLYQRVEPATVMIHITMEDGTTGAGSGFFIDPKGWIVTNFHVAGIASQLEVELYDGTRLPAQGYLVASQLHDLAVIKVDPPANGVKVLSLQAEIPPIGTPICTVGSPLGMQKSLTAGCVSSQVTGRQMRQLFEHQGVDPGPIFSSGLRDNITWIQIDAAISHGNSGGPLINYQGEVVGVNTLGLAPLGAENMNFAVPARYIRELLKESNGRILPLSEMRP